MQDLLISVIIPLFNSEQYIAATLESVLKQKDIGYEIIVVDDGSTDNSYNVCISYQSDHIRLFHQNNRGAPSARNKGIACAKGKYLLFLDSDDFLCDGLFEKLEPYIREGNDCIIGDFIRMLPDGDVVDKSSVNGRNLFSYYYLAPYPCNKLYKREMMINNDLIFADVKISQDLNFYYKFLGISDEKSIIIIPVCFCKYRWVNGSISHSVSKNILDIAQSVDDCIDYYKGHNAEEKLPYLYVGAMRHVCYQIEKTAFFANNLERKCYFHYLVDYWDSLRKKARPFGNWNYLLKRQKALFQFVYTVICVWYSRKKVRR